MDVEKTMQERKVLIVDDDPDILLYLSEFLNSKGYTTLTASCGNEALEKLDRDHPDLVLLDVMMPDMDGFEVCRRIRANAATALLPVVMVTGSSKIIDATVIFSNTSRWVEKSRTIWCNKGFFTRSPRPGDPDSTTTGDRSA